MGTHENKELTKKVLNALDPKYILSQDQQSKITNVFRRFRDHEKDIQTIAQKAAMTGKKHLDKTKDWMGKMGTKFKNTFKRTKGGNKTRKSFNTSANLVRK